MSIQKRIQIISVLLFFAMAVAAHAHAPEQSYIYLQFHEESISGRFESTTQDLNKALDLELKPGLTKDDLAPYLKDIQNYFVKHSSFGSKVVGEYRIRFTEPSFLRVPRLGDFVQINFELEGVNEIPERLEIKYGAFFETSSSHRTLLVVEYDWKAGIYANESISSLVFAPNDTRQELPTSVSASLFLGFIAMIKLGIWHIWIGFDHILFLLALLLPSVMALRSEQERLDPSASGFWKPVTKFKPALLNVAKIITCFTIAHTITLSLATLEIVTLPSRLVESIIAISIALAALHIIRPLVGSNEWIIAFGFGLFHGFGFAGVLAEKGFGGDFLILTLLGFNLGVEIGQLVIILLLFPILFFLRNTRIYSKLLIVGASILIFISLYWFLERSLDIDLPVGRYVLRFLGALNG